MPPEVRRRVIREVVAVLAAIAVGGILFGINAGIAATAAGIVVMGLAFVAATDFHEHEGGRSDEGEAHDHDARGGGGDAGIDPEQDPPDGDRRQDGDDFADDPAANLGGHGEMSLGDSRLASAACHPSAIRWSRSPARSGWWRPGAEGAASR